MAIHVMTDREAQLFQWVVDEVRKLTGRSPPKTPAPEEPDYTGPETYVAYPQETDGIPALVSGEEGYPDEPGYAVCDIYKIDENTDPPSLVAVTNLYKYVYNLTSSALPQDWLLVHRDKFGRWVASSSSSASKYGKLDDNPWTSGTATVSIWANGADTEEDLTVSMPPWITSESSWDVDGGTWVRLEYFACDAKWYATPFAQVTVQTGLQYDEETHYVNVQTRTVVVNLIGDESDWTNSIGLTSVTVLIDHRVDTANKKLQKAFRVMYVMSAEESGSWEDEHVGAICT